MFNSPLPQSNLAIMKALACYRFLTVAQMVRLNIAKSQPNTYTALSKFKKSKLTKKASHRFYVGMVEAFYFGVGFPSLYFLTKKGAVYLSEYEDIELKDIQYFKGNPSLSTVSLRHKIALVDFHISLIELITSKEKEPHFPQKLRFFDTYLESEGSNASKKADFKEVKTKVYLTENYTLKGVTEKRGFIIPDAIFRVQIDDDFYPFCILEVDRTKNTKRCIEQIRWNLWASADYKISKKYEDKPHRGYPNFIIYIFENDNMPALVKKRFHEKYPKWIRVFDFFVFLTTAKQISDEKNFGMLFKEMHNKMMNYNPDIIDDISDDVI